MVSLISNGSDITTSMGHSFKTISRNSKKGKAKQHFKKKHIFFESHSADH